MASSADVAVSNSLLVADSVPHSLAQFDSIHIELLPKQKLARSSPKLSPVGMDNKPKSTRSKWTIVRER
jgi:hypothetical protein